MEIDFEALRDSVATYNEDRDIATYKDPEKFLPLISIVHGNTNEQIQFEPTDIQSIAIEALLGDKWIMALKARQMGMTTLSNAMLLYLCIYTPNAYALIMALKNENAELNLSAIKRMFWSLPEWYRAQFYEFDDAFHKDNSSTWTFHNKYLGNLVQIRTGGATAPDGVRGLPANIFHFTEFGFWEYAKVLWDAFYPMIKKRRNSSYVIIESTAKGRDNLFYQMAIEGLYRFKVLFFPWFSADDSYMPTDKVYSLEERKSYQRKYLMCDDDMVEKLTDEQVEYYLDIVYGSGVKAAMQEYPGTPEAPFVASELGTFSSEAMDNIDLYPTVVENCKLNINGLTVYAEPVMNHEYIAYADTKDQGEDHHVMYITGPNGQLMCEFRQNYSAPEFIPDCHTIISFYNNALFGIERKSTGTYISETLKSVYNYKNFWSYDGKNIGLDMNKTTKPLVISVMEEYISLGTVQAKGQGLSDEMRNMDPDTLKARRQKNIEPSDRIGDDRIMAFAGMCLMYREETPIIKSGNPTKRRKTKRKANTGYLKW